MQNTQKPKTRIKEKKREEQYLYKLMLESRTTLNLHKLRSKSMNSKAYLKFQDSLKSLPKNPKARKEERIKAPAQNRRENV